MVLARSCGITLVCAALALQVNSSEQSLLQRLREWCYGAQDKKGQKRRELDVSTCFGPLLQWILAWWPADQPRLALDAGCDDAGETLYGAVHQRGVSRLCHSRGLESGGGFAKGSLETALAQAARAVGEECPAALDGDRDERSRFVCPLALRQDRGVGLAPIHAYQQTGQFPSKGRRQVSQSEHGCPQCGQCVVWSSGLFFRGGKSLAVYITRALG